MMHGPTNITDRTEVTYLWVIYFLLCGAATQVGPRPSLDHTQSAINTFPMNRSSVRRRHRYIRKTADTRDQHTLARRDSNPLSPQSSDGRPTPYKARSVGPPRSYITTHNFSTVYCRQYYFHYTSHIVIADYS